MSESLCHIRKSLVSKLRSIIDPELGVNIVHGACLRVWLDYRAACLI